MRTSRTLPRILALLVLIVWVPLFSFGMKTLNRNVEAVRTPLDQFLIAGTRYWGQLGPDGKCLAYFVSNLDLPQPAPVTHGRVTADKLLPSPQFSLNGALRVNVFDKLALAKFSIDAEFSPLLALAAYSTSMDMGDTRVALDSPDSKMVRVMARSGSTASWSDTFRQPQGIYLIRRAEDRFILRLPESVQRMLRNRDLGETFQTSGLTELEEPAFQQCRAAVESPAAAGEQLADIGPYLRTFGINEGSPFVKNMIIRSGTAQ